MRIDFAANLFRYLSKDWRELSQTRLSNNDKVDIAMSFARSFRHGAENKGGVDIQFCKVRFEETDIARSLRNNTANVWIERMLLVGLDVQTVPVLFGADKIKLDQIFDFRLNRSDRQARLADDLS